MNNEQRVKLMPNNTLQAKVFAASGRSKSVSVSGSRRSLGANVSLAVHAGRLKWVEDGSQGHAYNAAIVGPGPQ